MERNIIRKKWQVTIPRGIRRGLNLFEGQTLNWEVIQEDTGTEIRLIMGSLARPEDMAAFKEAGARKARREARQHRRAAHPFGISDANKGREKLKALITEVATELLSRMPKAQAESEGA